MCLRWREHAESPHSPDTLAHSNQLQPPDKPIRSPDIDAMVRRLGQQLRQDFPNANLETFDNDFLAYVASKPGVPRWAGGTSQPML